MQKFEILLHHCIYQFKYNNHNTHFTIDIFTICDYTSHSDIYNTDIC